MTARYRYPLETVRMRGDREAAAAHLGSDAPGFGSGSSFDQGGEAPSMTGQSPNLSRVTPSVSFHPPCSNRKAQPGPSSAGSRTRGDLAGVARVLASVKE
jgi:hypothetical protein